LRNLKHYFDLTFISNLISGFFSEKEKERARVILQGSGFIEKILFLSSDSPADLASYKERKYLLPVNE